MAWDEISRKAEEENARDRERWVGVYIGVIAVVLALCSMGGDNAAKNATLKNIEAADTWAFFQAKNMRRHALRLETADLELRLISEPSLPDIARSAITAKITEYKKQDEVLTKDPERPEAQREGLDQLWEKGKRLEAERDDALRRDPYFDYGAALLQIAIILASISLITRERTVLALSGILGLFGAAFTLNGFALLLEIPLLGG